MGALADKTQQVGRWASDTSLKAYKVWKSLDPTMPLKAAQAPLPPAPPPAPDLTDAQVRAAADAEATRQMMGRGRRASFLTGGAGAGQATTLRKTLLGGGG